MGATLCAAQRGAAGAGEIARGRYARLHKFLVLQMRLDDPATDGEEAEGQRPFEEARDALGVHLERSQRRCRVSR